MNKYLNRRLLEILFFLAVMIFTFWALIKGQDLAAVWEQICKMSKTYLFMAGACAILYVSSEGIMIYYLYHPLDADCRFSDCIRYSFVGFFYCAITPSATGGQPMQIYYMTRDGRSPGQSTTILMVIAALNKLILVLTGLSIFFFCRSDLSLILEKYSLIFFLGMFFDFMWVLILFGVMFFPRPLKSGILRIIGWWGKKRQKNVDKARSGVENFFDQYRASVSFMKASPLHIGAAAIMTFVQRLFLLFLTWFIYRGLGLSGTSMIHIMILQAAILVAVDMMPIPGAQGITELMYIQAFVTIISSDRIMSCLYVTRGLNFYMLLIISVTVIIGQRFMYRKQNKSH